MTDQEFLLLKQRYYAWKGMQPQGREHGLEEVLRWGYETAIQDSRERAADLLFGKAQG